MLERMLVFVSKPSIVDELCNADPLDLSFLEAADDVRFQTRSISSSQSSSSLITSFLTNLGVHRIDMVANIGFPNRVHDVEICKGVFVAYLFN